jgi:hypothetical protein
MVAITETNDPKLDTKFHPEYESGKSGILLGINCVIPRVLKTPRLLALRYLLKIFLYLANFPQKQSLWRFTFFVIGG